ncbi:MAG: PAS domain-containing protein [Planctomycetes bacterium]|nr:PAS domain-containing protein [Planctomycetota bacterium]
MTVFFSPHADTFLASTAMAMMVVAVIMRSVPVASKYPPHQRPWPALGWLAASMLAGALVQCIGIYGLSEIDPAPYHTATAIILTASCVLPILAYLSEGEVSPEIRAVGAKYRYQLLAAPILAALALLLWYNFADGEPIGIFFLAKALRLAAISLAVWGILRHRRNLSPDVVNGLRLLVLFSLLYVLTPYPAIPEVVDTTIHLWGFIYFLIYVIRVAVLFIVAALMWNAHARSAGIGGQAKWWPLIVLTAIILSFAVFAEVIRGRYKTVVNTALANITYNLAANLGDSGVDFTVLADAGMEQANQRAGRMPRPPSRFKTIDNRRLGIGYHAPYTENTVRSWILTYQSNRRPAVISIADGSVTAPSWRVEQLQRQVGEGGGEIISGLFDPKYADALAVAPIPSGRTNSRDAAMVSVRMEALELDFFRFKRLPMLLVPIVFFILLSLFHNYMRSWLALGEAGEAKAFLEGVLGNEMSGVVVETDRTVDTNRRALDILGVEQSALADDKLFETLRTRLVEGEPGNPYPTLLHTVFQCDNAEVELALHSNSRKMIHLLISTRELARRVHGRDARLYEFVDITNQKDREAEIRQLHRLIHTLVDLVNIPMFVKNTNGRYLIVNRAFARMVLADEPDDVIRKRYIDFDPDGIHQVKRSDDACCQKRGKPFSVTMTFPDGITYEVVKTLVDISLGGANEVIVGIAEPVQAGESST